MTEEPWPVPETPPPPATAAITSLECVYEYHRECERYWYDLHDNRIICACQDGRCHGNAEEVAALRAARSTE